MNIYIPIEIKARELEGRGLLAVAAAERGHLVILGDKNDTRGLCKKGLLPRGILHEKSLTPSKSTVKYFNKLSENGYVITSQDEESGLVNDEYSEFAKGRFSKKTLSSTQRVFSWGKYDNDCLKKIYKKHSDRFVESGSPRVDFWREDFEPYFSNTPNVLKNVNKPYIFIPSNFSFLLGEDRIWNIIARMRFAGYFERGKGGEYDEFRLYEDMSFRIRLIGEFVKMVRAIADTFKELEIILRPHPVEIEDAWVKMLGDIPNVKVIRDGGISGWIRNAEIVINNGCTSALEAAACGIKRIAYRPFESDYENKIPNEVCHHADNLDELISIVEKMLKDQSLSDDDRVAMKTNEILRSRFSNLTGKLAADRIAEEWEKIDHPSLKTQSTIEELLNSRKQDKPSLLYQLKRYAAKLKNLILLNKTESDEKEQLLFNPNKFPDLKEEEIEHILVNLRHTLNRFHDVRYRRFGEKSFILYKDSKK